MLRVRWDEKNTRDLQKIDGLIPVSTHFVIAVNFYDFNSASFIGFVEDFYKRKI